jgi:dihydroxyacetone kinase
VPFSDTLAAEIAGGADLATAWQRAADATTAAAAATADLLPRMGRARPHAEKSLGTPDAGAYSLGLIVQSIAVVLASHREEK